MTVRYIEDYRTKCSDLRPREVCFYSATYRNKNGEDSTVNICVRIENGDVAAVLDAVMENGGIGNLQENGTFLFIPWPCAVIEIKDV